MLGKLKEKISLDIIMLYLSKASGALTSFILFNL